MVDRDVTFAAAALVEGVKHLLLDFDSTDNLREVQDDDFQATFSPQSW